MLKNIKSSQGKANLKFPRGWDLKEALEEKEIAGETLKKIST